MTVMDCPEFQSVRAALAGSEWLGPDPRASLALANSQGFAGVPKGWPGPEECEMIEPSLVLTM
eukprot:15483105-Alexandrium_andersonii.AAC.1